MLFRPLLLVATLGLVACDRAATPPSESDTDTDTDTDTDADTDTDTDTDTDADADTDTDTDTDTDADCGTPSPLGPWAGHPIDVATTSTPYTNTSGLGDVVAATPASGADPAVISTVVTDAIITFKDFNAVWLGAGDGHIQAYQIDELNALNVGDSVSFTATEVTNFFGQAEITAIDTTAGVTVGSSDNEVYVLDASSTVVDYPTHQGQVVEFYGSVGAALADDCGSGRTCWPITNDGTTNTVNVPDNFTPAMTEGECFHIIAPVIYSWNDVRISGGEFDAMQYY